MKQETLKVLEEYLSDGQRHTVEEMNKYLSETEGKENDYCMMLEEDGNIRTMANLNGLEPEYFVELVEKKK